MAGLGGGLIVADAAAKFLEKAYKEGWLDKIIARLKKKHRVLVLGVTGTGKTAFLESLNEVVPKAIDVMNRTEFAEKHRARFSKQTFLFTDTPGQIHHAPRRIQAIKDAMKVKGGIAGVINLVSYGYHESRAVAKPEIKENGKVPEAFLKRQRLEEIEMLNEWVSLLGGAESAGWLITVVTKADLWWKRRDEVMAYYQNGHYHQALGEAKSLKPVVLEYSSVFQKFCGQGAMSGDFQDSDRDRVKAQMIRALLVAVTGERHA